jgi:hypothetical protein
LLTVTVTVLELVAVPEPLVKPFCVAAARAAAVVLTPPLMNSVSAAAKAAASAADCILSLARQANPTSVASPTIATKTTSAMTTITITWPRWATRDWRALSHG